MSLQVIPTQVHGVLDYLTGSALLAAPRLLGIKDDPRAALTLWLAGAGATAYSLLTAYELGLMRLHLMPAHLVMDAMSGPLLVSSPWLFGFADRGTRYRLPHALVGATETLAASTTSKTVSSTRQDGASSPGFVEGRKKGNCEQSKLVRGDKGATQTCRAAGHSRGGCFEWHR